MIGADSSGNRMASGRLVEHPADNWAVDGVPVYAETDDASRMLVEDDQDPVGLENYGLATEEVDAPQPAHELGRTSPTPGKDASQNLISGPFCRIPYLLSSNRAPAVGCL